MVHLMKKITIYPLALIVFICLLSPLHAATEENPVPPILSLLLSNSGTVQWQGREWQQSDDGNKYTWTAANTYCQDLELGGHSDWVLPSLEELESLVICADEAGNLYPPGPTWSNICCEFDDSIPPDYKKPTIDSSFQAHLGPYWTSERFGNLVPDVRFQYGCRDLAEIQWEEYVRCVREN